MTSRPTPPAGDVPARRASYATSCTAICVVGSVSRRSWSASSITRRLGTLPPHESHHLPAVVIIAGCDSSITTLSREAQKGFDGRCWTTTTTTTRTSVVSPSPRTFDSIYRFGANGYRASEQSCEESSQASRTLAKYLLLHCQAG